VGLITRDERRALRRLNKKEVAGDENLYIPSIANNPLATEVKIADLKDNMDADRFLRNGLELTEKDMARMKKYDEQLRYLLKASNK
jgi:hypothetical protein